MQPINGDDIDKAGQGVEHASNGLSKLLESLGNFFGLVQKYWKGLVIIVVVVVVVIQWYRIGTEYAKGYNTAKKEDENYQKSLKSTIDYQQRQLDIIQAQYDTMYVKWREAKDIAYQQLIIKKEQP